MSKPKPEFVYFIQRGPRGDIKIGYSANPGRRLAQLQTGCPDALQLIATLPGTTWFEHSLQRKFDEYHVNGEWFRPVPAIFLYIAEQIARRATDEDVFTAKPKPKPIPQEEWPPWPEDHPLLVQARTARANIAAMRAEMDARSAAVRAAKDAAKKAGGT